MYLHMNECTYIYLDIIFQTEVKGTTGKFTDLNICVCVQLSSFSAVFAAHGTVHMHCLHKEIYVCVN